MLLLVKVVEEAYHNKIKMEYPLLSTGCHSNQYRYRQIENKKDDLNLIF